MLKKLLFPLALVLYSSTATAQTTLAAGNLLFTSFNTTSNTGTADTVSFVLLVPITANTVIYFSDRGFQNPGWQAAGTTEGVVSWTSGTALAIGSEVQIAGLGASVNGVSNGTVAVVSGSGGILTGGLSLGNLGDQIMAFQGAAGDPTNAGATYIAGINWQLNCGTTTDANWNGGACSFGPQSSYLPTGLTNGVSSMLAGVAGSAPGYNAQGKFNCSAGTPFSTVAALRTAVLNKANWTFSTTTTGSAFNVPPGCNYYNASLPVSIVSFSSSCDDDAEVVKWSAESETRFDHYELEYSSDLETFYQIAYIRSKNTPTSLTHYEIKVDPELFGNDFSYFRLKMVDVDGSIEYLEPISSQHCQQKTTNLLSSYSFHDQLLNLKLNKTDVSIELFTSNGQPLCDIVELENEFEVSIPLSNTSDHVLILKIYSVEHSKFVIYRIMRY